MTSVKIAMIGAGSAQFSAGVVRDLCVTPGLAGSHVTLMDIDAKRLENVLHLASRLTEEIHAEISFSSTTERAQAIQGADFVINSAQAGGHSWVEAQRSLAEKHGYYRGVGLQEFTQMELMMDVAQDVERICPNAWLIQISNPVFEGCTWMSRQTNLKVLGLCHGHYGYREIAEELGLELEHVSAQMPGFNHWIWMTDFRYKGQNAYPLLDEWIATQSEEYWARDDRYYWHNQLSRAAVHAYRFFGWMPIGDTPRFSGWWYLSDLESRKHWYGQHWGGFDSEIGWNQYLEDMYAQVTKIETVLANPQIPITNTFPAVQSDEQIVPIIDSLVNDKTRLYQVNIPNKGGLLPGFPDDLVIECQGVVNAAGIHGIQVPSLPRKLMAEAMIPRWHRAELTVEAMATGDRDLLLAYLLYDQRTRSLEQAEGLLDEWLADPRSAGLARKFSRYPAL
jgi:alpha-galactosidase